MKKIILLSFCLLFFGLGLTYQSCTDATAMNQSETMLVPSLLNRHPSLYMGKEWDDTQNRYVKYRDDFTNQKHKVKAALQLASIFVAEARVTGEHGHYYPAALKMTETVLSLQEASPDDRFLAMSMKAGVQLSLHQFQSALITAKEAVALNPNNAQIYGALTDAYVELGQYQEAIKSVDQMMAIRPDIRSYARVSYLREIHGNVEGAIYALQEAIRSGSPTSEDWAWAVMTLGELHHRNGSPELTAKAYDYLLVERPDYPFAIAGKAKLAMEGKDFEKAMSLLDTAITAIPEVGFYTTKVELLRAMGKKAAAEALFPEIMEMLADDTKHGHIMNLEYAHVYGDLQGDWANAKKYALLEYNERPDNIDVNRELAKICLALNDIESAKKHLAIATSTGSKHPDLIALKKKIG